MVDRSLETLAADRGITICFADLDGVDGLWLPEERTILVSRRLGDRRAAEVLDHELTHVDIEDGHAALDAAVRRRAGRTRLAVTSAAAACLVLLVAVRVQFSGDPTGDVPQQRSAADHTSAAPQTAHPPPSGGTSTPVTGSPTTVVTQVFNGEVRTHTVTVPAPTATPSPTPAKSAASRVTPPGPTQPVGTISTSPTTSPPPPPTTTPPPPSPSDSPTPSASPTGMPAATTIQQPVVN